MHNTEQGRGTLSPVRRIVERVIAGFLVAAALVALVVWVLPALAKAPVGPAIDHALGIYTARVCVVEPHSKAIIVETSQGDSFILAREVKVGSESYADTEAATALKLGRVFTLGTHNGQIDSIQAAEGGSDPPPCP